ncbi:vacuolar ATPase assembly integral membrane protein VMA21 homolog [Drosophila pseudoobscura]|uniref:Vacuolar ATPase assembly integral membrane protein VMA21 homolog n=1 Tax=Drosophila pseudoobscura pseudoobscura TaxID=46245 RepID=A0A6I8VTU8_DROPS|nr:vacuolar ATPase assembly integral membrane protein VMA21 homolog [Drosophila pseudoobscura]
MCHFIQRKRQFSIGISSKIFRKMTSKTKKTSAGIGGAAARSKQARQQSEDSQDYSSFKTVIFYWMLIVFLPVITFFLLKAVVLDGSFGMSELKVNISSAVGAMVALHIALGLFIYRAYFEGSGSKASKVD